MTHIKDGSTYRGFKITRSGPSEPITSDYPTISGAGMWRATKGDTRLSSWSASGLKQLITEHESGLETKALRYALKESTVALKSNESAVSSAERKEL